MKKYVCLTSEWMNEFLKKVVFIWKAVWKSHLYSKKWTFDLWWIIRRPSILWHMLVFFYLGIKVPSQISNHPKTARICRSIFWKLPRWLRASRLSNGRTQLACKCMVQVSNIKECLKRNHYFEHLLYTVLLLSDSWSWNHVFFTGKMVQS